MRFMASQSSAWIRCLIGRLPILVIPLDFVYVPHSLLNCVCKPLFCSFTVLAFQLLDLLLCQCSVRVAIAEIRVATSPGIRMVVCRF